MFVDVVVVVVIVVIVLVCCKLKFYRVFVQVLIPFH